VSVEVGRDGLCSPGYEEHFATSKRGVRQRFLRPSCHRASRRVIEREREREWRIGRGRRDGDARRTVLAGPESADPYGPESL
jgi:hypothetical protein